jgi:hypothetical protein
VQVRQVVGENKIERNARLFLELSTYRDILTQFRTEQRAEKFVVAGTSIQQTLAQDAAVLWIERLRATLLQRPDAPPLEAVLPASVTTSKAMKYIKMKACLLRSDKYFFPKNAALPAALSHAVRPLPTAAYQSAAPISQVLIQAVIPRPSISGLHMDSPGVRQPLKGRVPAWCASSHTQTHSTVPQGYCAAVVVQAAAQSQCLNAFDVDKIKQDLCHALDEEHAALLRDLERLQEQIDVDLECATSPPAAHEVHVWILFLIRLLAQYGFCVWNCYLLPARPLCGSSPTQASIAMLAPFQTKHIGTTVLHATLFCSNNVFSLDRLFFLAK